MNADGSVTDTWQDSDVAVYAFTFTPETAQQRISGRAATITGYGLAHGLTTSLLAKLNAAQADFQACNTSLVCGDLQDTRGTVYGSVRLSRPECDVAA
jgi:hypothetical protein